MDDRELFQREIDGIWEELRQQHECYEIYVRDLKADVQKNVLAFLGLKTAEDGNFDVVPIAVLPKPEDLDE